MELDFRWSSHTCGYSGDGAANLGAELKVFVVDEPVQLAVDPRFESSLTLQPDGSQPTELGEAPRSENGLTTIGPLPSPCSELTVEIIDDQLSARFAARLATPGEACD